MHLGYPPSSMLSMCDSPQGVPKVFSIANADSAWEGRHCRRIKMGRESGKATTSEGGQEIRQDRGGGWGEACTEEERAEQEQHPGSEPRAGPAPVITHPFSFSSPSTCPITLHLIKQKCQENVKWGRWNICRVKRWRTRESEGKLRGDRETEGDKRDRQHLWIWRAPSPGLILRLTF